MCLQSSLLRLHGVRCGFSPGLQLQSHLGPREGVHVPPSRAPCLSNQLSHQFCRSLRSLTGRYCDGRGHLTVHFVSGNSKRLGKSRSIVGFLNAWKIITCLGRDSRPEPRASWQPYPLPTMATARCPQLRVCDLRFPKLRLCRTHSGRGHSRMQYLPHRKHRTLFGQ